MITRTITQAKVFDIKARGITLMCHGFSDYVKGITWVEGYPWESDEDCNKLLDTAIAEWEERRRDNPWGTTSHKPELIIYWKNISENY
jgi:hypothetical protein